MEFVVSQSFQVLSNLVARFANKFCTRGASAYELLYTRVNTMSAAI